MNLQTLPATVFIEGEVLRDAAEVIDLTHEQQKVLIGLLDAERRHVLNWWTCLNELRIHKQLPEWARSGPFGGNADYCAWAEDRKALNRALFGQELPASTEPVEA